MTTLADALVLYLSGQRSLGAAGARVHQDNLDQEDAKNLPAIVIRDPDEAGGHHQRGADGLIEAKIQIDAWADSKPEATTVRNALNDLLDGYPRGKLGGSGQTVEVDGIHVDNRYLHDHAGDEASDSNQFQGILALTIWYRESTPAFD